MPYFVTGLYYFCFAVLIGLTLFIYHKNPASWLNRYFALFALSILGWLVTLYFFSRQPDTPLLTTLGRANFAFAACIVLFGYLFLPQVAQKTAKLAPVLFLETALLVVLTLGTGLIDYSEHLRQGQNVTVFGPLFPLYIAHLVGYIGAALYFVFLANRKATLKIRGQLAIIGFGMLAMALIALVTNIVLPYVYHIFDLQDVGALSTIALLSAIAYAISTQQLFDIRIIIRRTVIFTVLFGLIATVYSASVLLVSAFALSGSPHLDWPTIITNLATISFIGFIFEPLRRWLTEYTDHFLYKADYDRQEVLDLLTKKLNDVVTLDEALEILMQTMVRELHLKRAITYVFQAGENGTSAIKRIKQVGYSDATSLLQWAEERVLRYFNQHPEILLREPLELILAQEAATLKNPRQAAQKGGTRQGGTQKIGLISTFLQEHETKVAVHQTLKALEATVAVPLQLGEQPIGLIFLSGKGSGEAYTQDDIRLLETIGSQAISSIQKARLYEGDQMKSEFVSIASHELLTPISAMQGYLSMILDEHIGTVDEQARGYLDKVYTSAKRLSVLVKDLLSVSRIEADRMKFEPQALDIEKLIVEAVDQLHFTAQDKGLALDFAPPQTPILPVWADPDRTMEVLVNLIGNAIKYTPQGTVTIRASNMHVSHGATPAPLNSTSPSAPAPPAQAGVAAQAPQVKVEVVDTGLGMTKQAQSHLFEKFYRVATAQTEGIAGTGLGLYITKSMVEKMGGSISVHSVVGQGSTFTFNLPVFRAEQVEEKSIG